ncbi:uncharacterized protein LOC131954263 [Physella acuta]|uniref:uncharacterized protein LOC131954263 n=1 Tax=Physella acuta TaxID=109671 RepID=UPI0027DCA172|nr:uncharacterized protein LOC131954263 [Physella acuta]XP_059173825.1 uncharacterized protein LOC131954263 [Physella acuta]XP_059173826.1 uncharacterized protein LOC131954263 [Physella acuta]
MEGWVLQLLLLALLSWIVTESSLFFADILECDGTNKGFNYKVNTESTVCCILEKEECKRTTENDQLYFELKPETEQVPEPSWYNLSLGPCKTQLTVNSTAASTMVVSCYKNKYKLAGENMHFIDKPAKPVISDIKYYENKSVEIYFQVNTSTLFADEFHVFLARQEYQREKTYNVCLTNCSEASSANNFTCKCTIKLKTFLTQDIRIVINVTRVIESNSVIEFYKLSRQVVPGNVRGMKVSNKTQTSAVLKFEPSRPLIELMGYMDQAGKPLNYSVVLVKNNGTNYKLTFVIQAGKPPDNLDQASVYVQFKNLEPFTNYTVTVSGIGGGGEGNISSQNFATKMSVPRSPAKIENFNFFRSNYTIYFIWKPVSNETLGGRQLYYDITIDTGNWKNTTNTSENFKLLDYHNDSESLDVKIWTLNEKGRSANYSHIVIPSLKGFEAPLTAVEFLKDGYANVYYQCQDLQNVENIAIHVCEAGKSQHLPQEYICVNYPLTKVINMKNKSCTANTPFTVPLFQKSEIKEYKNSTQIEYYFEENNNLRFNTTADVLTNHLVEDSFILKDTENTKVFVSSMINKVWMGMAPVNCYYNSEKGATDVTIIQQPDGLKITQECHKTPNQVLAKYFQVYSSPDSECSNPKKLKYIGKFSSDVFSGAEIRLESDVKFVCVEVYAQTKTVTKQFAVTQPVQVMEADKNTIIIAASVCATVLVSIILFIICCCMCRRCRKRKGHFAKLSGSASPEDPKPTTNETQLVSPDAKSETYNDSGHGTSCTISSDFSSGTVPKNPSNRDDIRPTSQIRRGQESNYDAETNPLLKDGKDVQEYLQMHRTSDGSECGDLSNDDREKSQNSTNFNCYSSNRAVPRFTFVPSEGNSSNDTTDDNISNEHGNSNSATSRECSPAVSVVNVDPDGSSVSDNVNNYVHGPVGDDLVCDDLVGDDLVCDDLVGDDLDLDSSSVHDTVNDGVEDLVSEPGQESSCTTDTGQTDIDGSGSSDDSSVLLNNYECNKGAITLSFHPSESCSCNEDTDDNYNDESED